MSQNQTRPKRIHPLGARAKVKLGFTAWFSLMLLLNLIYYLSNLTFWVANLPILFAILLQVVIIFALVRSYLFPYAELDGTTLRFRLRYHGKTARGRGVTEVDLTKLQTYGITNDLHMTMQQEDRAPTLFTSLVYHPLEVFFWQSDSGTVWDARPYTEGQMRTIVTYIEEVCGVRPTGGLAEIFPSAQAPAPELQPSPHPDADAAASATAELVEGGASTVEPVNSPQPVTAAVHAESAANTSADTSADMPANTTADTSADISANASAEDGGQAAAAPPPRPAPPKRSGWAKPTEPWVNRPPDKPAPSRPASPTDQDR